VRLKQFLIALDQLINTLVGGWADETLSARAYRCHRTKPHWRTVMYVLDAAFFWQDAHCSASFRSEMERLHLPLVYRQTQ